MIEVKNGYARNYLIPQGFATAWTRGGAKQVESIQAARKARAIHDRDEAVALKDAIEGGRFVWPSRLALLAASSVRSRRIEMIARVSTFI